MRHRARPRERRLTPKNTDAGPTDKPPRKPPAYRLRAGYTQAIVILTDSATRERRDYWLGEYGSPESRELYYRLLAEYEALGRRPPDRPLFSPADSEAERLERRRRERETPAGCTAPAPTAAGAAS